MVRFLVQLEISLALNFSLTLLLWAATFNAQLLDGWSGNAAQTFMSRINAATFLACDLEPSWGQNWNLLHALLSCCSCILCSNVQTQTMGTRGSSMLAWELRHTDLGNDWRHCQCPKFWFEHVCCGVCSQSELCGVLPHIPGDTVDLRHFLQRGDRRCSGIGVHNRQTNIFHRLREVQQEKVIYPIAFWQKWLGVNREFWLCALVLQVAWFLPDPGRVCRSVSTGFDWTPAWNAPQVLWCPPLKISPPLHHLK